MSNGRELYIIYMILYVLPQTDCKKYAIQDSAFGSIGFVFVVLREKVRVFENL